MSVLSNRGFQASTWLELGNEAHEMRYELDRDNRRVCIYFTRDEDLVLDIGADDLQAVIELGKRSLRELAGLAVSAPDES